MNSRANARQGSGYRSFQFSRTAIGDSGASGTLVRNRFRPGMGPRIVGTGLAVDRTSTIAHPGSPSLTNDPDRLARFQREAQVLAALNHPNIAAIFPDGGKDLVRSEAGTGSKSHLAVSESREL
jgi:hypothetical protein